MSSYLHRAFAAAAVAAVLGGTAGAQLLPSVGLPALPPVNLPTGNVPVVGPTLQNILAQPGASEAVAPTLNTVSGLPQRIAEAPPATLLELRKLRLRELIRQNPRELEADGSGQPVRRGVLVVVDPDQASLQLAARAGFRIIADDARCRARHAHRDDRGATRALDARRAQAPAQGRAGAPGRFRPSVRTRGS